MRTASRQLGVAPSFAPSASSPAVLGRRDLGARRLPASPREVSDGDEEVASVLGQHSRQRRVHRNEGGDDSEDASRLGSAGRRGELTGGEEPKGDVEEAEERDEGDGRSERGDEEEQRDQGPGDEVDAYCRRELARGGVRVWGQLRWLDSQACLCAG